MKKQQKGKKELWLISKYALTPKTGSQEQRLYNIASLIKDKYVVTLITSNSNHLGRDLPTNFKLYKQISDKDIGFDIIYIKSLSYPNSTSWKRILSWIIFEFNLFLYILFFSKKKPSIVFISSLSLLTVYNGLLLKLLYKSKFILDIRDIWPLTLIELKNVNKFNPLVLWLRVAEFIGYRYSDIVTSSIKFFKNYNRTVERKFVWLPQLYTPVEQRSSDFDFNQIRNNYTTIVCYSGSIGFINKIDLLIEAAKLASLEKIFYLIVGGGPQLSFYKKQTEGLTNILFLGQIPRDQVQFFLSNSDILLHLVENEPTRVYSYGNSPQKYLDYYLSGKPFILTDTYSKLDDVQSTFIYQTGDGPRDIVDMIKKIREKKHNKQIQIEYFKNNHTMNEQYKGRLYEIFEGADESDI